MPPRTTPAVRPPVPTDRAAAAVDLPADGWDAPLEGAHRRGRAGRRAPRRRRAGTTRPGRCSPPRRPRAANFARPQPTIPVAGAAHRVALRHAARGGRPPPRQRPRRGVGGSPRPLLASNSLVIFDSRSTLPRDGCTAACWACRPGSHSPTPAASAPCSPPPDAPRSPFARVGRRPGARARALHRELGPDSRWATVAEGAGLAASTARRPESLASCGASRGRRWWRCGRSATARTWGSIRLKRGRRRR